MKILSFKQYIVEVFENLLENRLEYLEKKNPTIPSAHDTYAKHREAKDIIHHFATHADPTKNKQYTQWIINKYKNGNFRQEDAPRVKEALSKFDKYKGKMEHKDIGHYKNLNHLEDETDKHSGAASKKEEARMLKHEGADVVHEGNGVSVHKLKTHEAACKYGAGTKWCTASKSDPSMYKHYSSEGPLYVVQHRDKEGKIRKHQFHFESNQFMNEKDEPIDLHHFVHHEVPELQHVKEFKPKHHAFASSQEEFDKYANA